MNKLRRTNIVGTIGPASESEEMLTKLINAGLNVTRINFSHGGYEENGVKIETIKKVRKELNRPVALLLDTKGPEIRTGMLVSGKNDKLTIEEGQNLYAQYEQNIDNIRIRVKNSNIIQEDTKVYSVRMREL